MGACRVVSQSHLVTLPILRVLMTPSLSCWVRLPVPPFECRIKTPPLLFQEVASPLRGPRLSSSSVSVGIPPYTIVRSVVFSPPWIRPCVGRSSRHRFPPMPLQDTWRLLLLRLDLAFPLRLSLALTAPPIIGHFLPASPPMPLRGAWRLLPLGYD